MILFAPWLVVPGRSIGGVALGSDLSTLDALGKPTYGDAAMQKSWSTWIGKGGGRIDVFEANDDAGTANERRRIHVVRATSSRFHLADGLRPGSPTRGLRRVFLAAKVVGSYRAASGRVTIWDDVRRGLAWEAAPNGRALALLVHDAGRPISSTVGPYVSSPLQKG